MRWSKKGRRCLPEIPSGIRVKILRHPSAEFEGETGTVQHRGRMTTVVRLDTDWYETEDWYEIEQVPRVWTKDFEAGLVDDLPDGTPVRIIEHPSMPEVVGRSGVAHTAQGLTHVANIVGDLLFNWTKVEEILEEEAAAEKTVDYKEKYDALWDTLREDAIKRGWCLYYDELARKHDGPGRIARYRVRLALDVEIMATDANEAMGVAKRMIPEGLTVVSSSVWRP